MLLVFESRAGRNRHQSLGGLGSSKDSSICFELQGCSGMGFRDGGLGLSLHARSVTRVDWD